MSRTSLDKLVIAEVTGTGARERQNTHEAAAQASAAKLLLLLRDDQKRIEQDISEPEQGYLKDYVAWKRGQAEMPILPENSFNITGILSFIDYVVEQTTPPFNDAKKQTAVFFEMGRLVALGRDEWTRNGVYDNGEMRVVDASLGETLDLVCAATLGDYVPGYTSLGQANETDKQDRMLSLFNCLVSLAASKKCTGGRQHDLLFLLNHVYPVLQDGAYHPVKMIEDDRGFLLDLMNDFLSNAAREAYRDEAALLAFTREWVQYEASATDVFPAGVKAWFAGCIPRLTEHLNEQCKKNGLNPFDPRIQEKITHFCSAADALNVPRDIYPLMPLFIEIYSLKEESESNPIRDARNAALLSVKGAIDSAESFVVVTDLLNYFFEAERLYQKLKLDLTREIELGEEEKRFYSIVDRLSVLLIQRFSDISRDPHHPVVSDEFTVVKKNFEERANFHALLPPDFVSNYFTHIKENPVRFETFLERARNSHRRKSILLDDSTIDAWLSRSPEDLPADNEVVDGIKISPYQINRILLHALVSVDKSDIVWSDTFKYALTQVILWIKDPSTETLSTEFKKSYPIALLHNLLFMALTRDFRFVVGKIKAIFDSNPKSILTDHYAEILYRTDISSEQRTILLNAIGDHLPNCISLEAFLKLSSEKLSDDARSAVLLQFKDQITLEFLKKRSTYSMTGSHLKIIVEAIKSKIIHSITGYDDLSRYLTLFSLYNPDEETRDSIFSTLLTAFGDQFSRLITRYFHFITLLESNFLTANTRKKVVDALVDHFSKIIETFSDLRHFLSLSGTIIDSEHKIKVLETIVKEHVISAITVNQLQELFALSVQTLDHSCRRILFLSIYNSRKIENSEELKYVLSLPDNIFYPEERLQFLQALKPTFPTIFNSGRSFTKIFQLPISDEEKQFIFSEVKKALRFLSAKEIVDFHIAAGETISLHDKQLFCDESHVSFRTLDDKESLFFLYNEGILSLSKLQCILSAQITSFDELRSFLSYYAKHPLKDNAIFDSIKGILLARVSRTEHLVDLLQIPFSADAFNALFSIILKNFRLEEIVKLFDSNRVTNEKKNQIKSVLKTMALDFIFSESDFLQMLKLGDILSKEERERCFKKFEVRNYPAINKLCARIAEAKLPADLYRTISDELFAIWNEKLCEFFVKRNPGVLSVASLRAMFCEFSSVENRYWSALFDVLIARGKIEVKSLADLVELYKFPVAQFTQAHRDVVWGSVEKKFVGSLDDEIDALFSLTREQFDDQKRTVIWDLYVVNKMSDYQKSQKGVVFLLNLAGKYFSHEASFDSFARSLLEKIDDQRVLIAVLKSLDTQSTKRTKEIVWKIVKDNYFPKLTHWSSIFSFCQGLNGLRLFENKTFIPFLQSRIQETNWRDLPADEITNEFYAFFRVSQMCRIQMDDPSFQRVMNQFFDIELVAQFFELLLNDKNTSFSEQSELIEVAFKLMGRERLITFFQACLSDPTPKIVNELRTISTLLSRRMPDFFTPPSPFMLISARLCNTKELQHYISEREKTLNKDKLSTSRFFKKDENAIEKGSNKVNAAKKLCGWADEGREGVSIFSHDELLALLEDHGTPRGDSKLRALAKSFLGDVQIKRLEEHVKTHPNHSLAVLGRNVVMWQVETALTATSVPSASR